MKPIGIEPSTEHAGGARRRFLALRVALFAAGAALLVAFVSRIGAEQIVTQLRHAGARALWIFVPYIAGTAIGALPWAALLPRGVVPSHAAVIESRFVASSANSLLPFFGMAGEPARLLWLPEHARSLGLAAIVVDRVLYNAANGCWLSAGALVALGEDRLRPAFGVAALVIGLLTLALTPVCLLVAARARIGGKVHGMLARVLGQRFGGDFGARFDGVLRGLVRGSRGRLVSGAALHLLGKGLLLLETPIGLLALGVHVSPEQALVLAVVPIALSFFFSSVPGLIGVQEGAQTLVASALGLAPAAVLALVLLQRFRQLVFAALMPVLLGLARPNEAQKTSVKSR